MRALPVLIFLCGSVAMAQPVSFGIRGGVPFTGAFSDTSVSEITSYSSSNSYLVGPMVEVHLPLGFSIEGDGLYHPLNLSQTTVTGATPANPSVTIHQRFTFQSWEFPVLVKYRFLHTPIVKPLVEAGPTFRATGQALSGNFSKAGFVLGGGVEVKMGHIRVEPELRYIRWGSDSAVSGANLAPSNVNQAELTLGLSF